MNVLRSLRSRVLVGSLLWTLGLLAATHLLWVALAGRYPMVLHMGHGGVVYVALAFMAAGLLGLQSGLTPFRELSRRLAAVRAGRERRLDGRYPNEVQPLVTELNALLEQRDQAVLRALARAGDLAHGLKTPLAVLYHEADQVEAAGHHDLATVIRQQVERMRRQADYHLVMARAASSGASPASRSQVLESVDGLVRTLSRLHAGRGLQVLVNVPPGHVVRGSREDLDELLGNLLDNAFKWAASRITVASAEHGSNVAITVDDDGAGIDPSQWERVLQRGVRADEAAAGSGFGLAIVRELAELRGGSIEISRAPDGGVRARLELPAA